LSRRKGDLLYNETIYPHQPQNERDGDVKKIFDGKCIEAISIGNGTASRETEFFIKKIALINQSKFYRFPEGASVYSAVNQARRISKL
jgi:uncharacterized protein